MALHCTRGIRNTRATIANYGEIKKKWSGSFKDAQIDKKYLRQLGFDTTVKKHECPQDKKALLELLNLVACKQESKMEQFLEVLTGNHKGEGICPDCLCSTCNHHSCPAPCRANWACEGAVTACEGYKPNEKAILVNNNRVSDSGSSMVRAGVL